MKINVNQNTLQSKLQKSKSIQKQSLKNLSKEKFPVGLSRLIITKVEHTVFDTQNQPGINKIRLYFNTPAQDKADKYYDFSNDFVFYPGKRKDTGEPICVGFERLYSFIYNAFGKVVPFEKEDIELSEAARILNQALTPFADQKAPFFGIVVHRETIYKDRLNLLPEVFLASVKTIASEITELNKIDSQMKNKVWRIKENEKKKYQAKKRNENSLPGSTPDDGFPETIESDGNDFKAMDSDLPDDDLPF